MSAKRYQISVILTDQCNLRCSYCTAPRRDVTMTATMAARLTALVERAAPTALDLNLHGGEPTLAWDRLVELSEALRSTLGARRSSFNMSTNGTLLTAERARYLAVHRFNVRLSIDGRRESHTLHRAPPGHQACAADAMYERTTTALRWLLEAGARTTANMVVTPATVDDLLANATYLVDQGLSWLTISPAIGVEWSGAQLLSLDRQLGGLAPLWRRHLAGRGPDEHEELRRMLRWELERARYCLGMHPNLPDALVLVIGPTGKIFGDDPDTLTEDALLLGHVDDIESLEDLPTARRTTFQLLRDQGLQPAPVALSLRRSCRILLRRLTELHDALFGAAPAPLRAGTQPGEAR